MRRAVATAKKKRSADLSYAQRADLETLLTKRRETSRDEAERWQSEATTRATALGHRLGAFVADVDRESPTWKARCLTCGRAVLVVPSRDGRPHHSIEGGLYEGVGGQA